MKTETNYIFQHPQREWFCEYERYDGGDAFLGDESIVEIIGWGKVMKPTDEAEKAKFRETEIVAMNLTVDGVNDNLIPYISNIDSAQEIDRKSVV